MPEQVAALASSSSQLERHLGLAPGALTLEIMVETPQAILDREEAQRPAARGRRRAAAASPRTSAPTTTPRAATSPRRTSTMTHPACDFAKHMMQVALAGTGVWLSDGATNILPVPPHRGAEAAR